MANAARLANRPTAACVHTEFEPLANQPAGHGTGEDEPAGHACPGGHSVHEDDDGFGWKRPAPHSRHALALAPLYRPGEHGLHCPDWIGANVPATHDEATVARVGQNVPATHAVHVDDAAVPCQKPGGQSRHALA